ncbi:hypothetical protein QQF64_002193 [Cirrhinus molitorella]|uniref:Secreted protein n=1 Tax=Cirrhinus molitorella TaxID=172907 RepID=A0ABR3MPF1_9TELE
MQVSAWLLWVAWLCTWTEAARQCECQCACPPEEEQVAQKPERSEGRGHLRHRLMHQRVAHRDRAHRRKVIGDVNPLQSSCHQSSAPAAAPVTGAGLDPDGALFNTHTD